LKVHLEKMANEWDSVYTKISASLLFEWDSRKARGNLEKHQVSFEEAATVFGDPIALEMDDPKHSSNSEARLYRIGRSAFSRLLLVVFTLRRRSKDGQEITRIISARQASRKEKGLYLGPNQP
jgi:uncharacterized DUF497 family protein